MKTSILRALILWYVLLSSGNAVERPNVLLVVVDDASWREYGAYGWTNVKTPHFDRIAKDGALFLHGYASAPSCAPARAALLTGRNFWELEQGAFIQAWVPGKFPVLPELLAAAGYHTGSTGKGWGPGVVEPGKEKRDLAGKVYSQMKNDVEEDGISPVDYAANFGKFLDGRKEGQPFFFWAGIMEPHDPHSAENHKKLGMPLDQVKMPGFLPDTPGTRRERADYLYEVEHADVSLGKLLAVLETRGELENTLVIFTADNGTPCPRAKANVHEWGVRVPLAMMWRGRMKAGRTVEDFVNFADIAPTVLAAAGVVVPKEMSGHSALEAMLSEKSGQVDGERTFTVCGLEWHGEMPPQDFAARTILDGRYQYIRNYGTADRFKLRPASARADGEFSASAESSGVQGLIMSHPVHPEVAPFTKIIQQVRPEEELYDLESDPWEKVNLAGLPGHAEIKRKLKERMETYQRSTQDPRVTGEMEIFNETRRFVQGRKAEGYGRKK